MLHSPSANLSNITFPSDIPKHYATSFANLVLELPLKTIVSGLLNIIIIHTQSCIISNYYRLLYMILLDCKLII